MSVWFAIPSAGDWDKTVEVLSKWKSQGYKVAVFRQGRQLPESVVDIQYSVESYAGWAASVNRLVVDILLQDSECTWVVTGGDDYLPDPRKTASKIESVVTTHFKGTLGVMQPTGDRWGQGFVAEYPERAYIDTSAASPWMGREWCQRAYQGQGPLCKDYPHWYADTELQQVASRLGLFWQNPRICQVHNHWTRLCGNRNLDNCPYYMRALNGKEMVTRALNQYSDRKSKGFPGSELL